MGLGGGSRRGTRMEEAMGDEADALGEPGEQEGDDQDEGQREDEEEGGELGVVPGCGGVPAIEEFEQGREDGGEQQEQGPGLEQAPHAAMIHEGDLGRIPGLTWG